MCMDLKSLSGHRHKAFAGTTAAVLSVFRDESQQTNLENLLFGALLTAQRRKGTERRPGNCARTRKEIEDTSFAVVWVPQIFHKF